MTPADTEEQQKQNREVRVFISSTFRDMYLEREELVKQVFPKIRKMCEDRGVAFADVDLRWGITDEQKSEGMVLPICLKEIERCRPFFIGLLGERYGWIPDHFPKDLMDQEQWLAFHAGASVTELEIYHGVLNRPEMAQRSYFYFRNSTFTDQFSEKEKKLFIEQPDETEISIFGVQEADRLAEERRQKLSRLKDHIRSSGLPVREYSDPRQLGLLVFDDLSKNVGDLFPADKLPDARQRERALHEAFLARCVYSFVGREDLISKIDAAATGNGPPLILGGESGSGKSALLASWLKKFREKNPSNPVVAHFIGASPSSADWRAMVRRLIREIQEHFGISAQDEAIRGSFADSAQELKEQFRDLLFQVALKHRVVLVIDGLNHLEDRDGSLDLAWLPDTLPADVRLILSTTPGRPLEAITHREWTVQQLGPLSPEEREKLSVEYLSHFRKSLSDEQIARVASCEQTGSPLYLRVLLEELKIHGDHFTLNERIRHYLDARTAKELYGKLLQRYEEDYERDSPGLVRNAMTAIWASKRGLSEPELMDLLGSRGKPFPKGQWIPLYLAAEHSLMNRTGFIGFASDVFREVIEERYLLSEKERSSVHLCLAEYFSQFDSVNRRKVDELPWQLLRSSSYDRLSAVLADPSFFDASWNANEFDLREYWTQIENNSTNRLPDGCKLIMNDPERYPRQAFCLARLLGELGHLQEALHLQKFLGEYFVRTQDSTALATSLGNMALILRLQGKFNEAFEAHQKEESLCRSLNLKHQLALSLSNQATILQAQNKFKEAIQLNGEAEKLFRDAGNRNAVAQCLGNQALIFYRSGDLDRAIASRKMEEKIFRETGNTPGLALCLAGQARLQKDFGNLEKANQLFQQATPVFRKFGSREELVSALNDEAAILMDLDQNDAAASLLDEAEGLARKSGVNNLLANTLGNRGLLLKRQKKFQESLALFREAEELYRESNSESNVAACLGNGALIQMTLGNYEAAMLLTTEAESIFQKLGDLPGVITSKGNRALLFQKSGRPSEGIPIAEEAYLLALGHGFDALAKEILPVLNLMKGSAPKASGASLTQAGRDERQALSKKVSSFCEEGRLEEALAVLQDVKALCRKQLDQEQLAEAFNTEAVVCNYLGEYDKALNCLREAEKIWRALASEEKLAGVLLNLSMLLEMKEQLSVALELSLESEQILRRLGKKKKVADLLGNRAVILQKNGDLKGAVALLQEQTLLARETGDQAGLAQSLGEQGIILMEQGRYDSALALLKEQEEINRKLNHFEGLATALANQAHLLAWKMRRIPQAISVAEEALNIASSGGLKALARQIAANIQSMKSSLR